MISSSPMPPALHRSILFWSGLLVIIFTCWAWRDSGRNQSSIYGKQLMAVSCNHGIMIIRQVGATFDFRGERAPISIPPDPYRSPFFVRSRATAPSIPEVIPPLEELQQLLVDHFPAGTWCLYLPYWLIVLSLPFPWSLLLLWRTRRWK
jgi:hypothetical protein